MSKEKALMSTAFKHLNGFKRARALMVLAYEENDTETAKHWKLVQYEYIDKLELALRGLQKENRERVVEDTAENVG